MVKVVAGQMSRSRTQLSIVSTPEGRINIFSVLSIKHLSVSGQVQAFVYFFVYICVVLMYISCLYVGCSQGCSHSASEQMRVCTCDNMGVCVCVCDTEKTDTAKNKLMRRQCRVLAYI